MSNSSGVDRGAISLDPQQGQRLRQSIPGLDDWPRSWHVDPADIPVGQQIVQVLTPFLLHLLDQGLTKTTLRRHRDNLWTLGGELIRCRYDDDELARMNVEDALRHLIEGDSGPLMWPRISDDGTGLVGCHLSKVQSLLAPVDSRRSIRLTQRPTLVRSFS